ncbi:MAG: LysM peptidoglycan-binding domain-containing protein [Cytophagaceae bacterium]|nr:LysM peptidoglycan-binding domain-containing protein [Cytophagaceae bacterium]MDW8456519.1 LysM peptidoglycan-binding domain-containing protein [Cytophagaceae bacterium]
MNKRKLLIYFIIIFSIVPRSILFAQQKKSKVNPTFLLAEKHFNNFQYYLAAAEYARVLKSDSNHVEATYKLAESYRMYYDYKNAEKYYKKVADKWKNEYPLARFWYATMLKDNGNYAEAIKQYERYRDEHSDTDLETELYREKALQEANGCRLAMEQAAKGRKSKYKLILLPKPVNSVDNDYAPIIWENDSSIIITSSRKGSVGGHPDNSFGGTFSDAYRFHVKKDSTWEIVHHNHHDAFHIINTPYSEMAGSMTADKKRIYFTRCDEKIKVDNYEEFNCVIYVSYLKNNKWSKPVKLNENINMPGQWNSQPSVSPDGNILFFVSKRPGGLGLHDIWYSTCNGDDNWGTPINLGDKINTLFRDVSPRYYAEQKVLFFSSDGHSGLGGLDIFMTKEEDGFSEIINVGAPINSNRDDFYFTLGEKRGYLTSNREGGYGGDDIYYFKIHSRNSIVNKIEDSTATEDEIPAIASEQFTAPKTEIITTLDKVPDGNNKTTSVNGLILDSLYKKPAANVEIIAKDETGDIIAKTTTNEKGSYSFNNLPANKKIQLALNNTNPKNNKYYKPEPAVQYKTLSIPVEDKNITVVSIPKDSLINTHSFSVKGRIISQKTNSPATKGVVELEDEFGNIVSSTPIKSDGSYSLSAPPTGQKSYVVKYKTSAPKDENFTHTASEISYKKKNLIPETTTSILAEISRESMPNAKSVLIEGTLLYDDNQKPARNVTILLVNKNGTTVKTTQTNEKGYFKFTNLNPSDYKVMIQQGNLKKDENRKYAAKDVRAKGLDMLSSKKIFENIYFDFDKYELRPEAKKTLDDLVKYYNENPDIQIELYSYTDSYGTYDYNKILSAKRGQSALEYLRSKGVNSSALVINAMGESGKKIASDLTELGRQLNRRVEISILGGGQAYQSPTVTYIVEPKKTLYSIAHEYGMTVEELKEINGLAGSDIYAFQPLRVRRTNSDGSSTLAYVTEKKRFSSKAEERAYNKYVQTLVENNKRVNKNNAAKLKALLDSAENAERLSKEINTNTTYEIYETSNITTYITQPQNTLYTIARLYGVTVNDLMQLNNLNSETIYIGQKIKVDLSRRDPSIKGYIVKEGDTIGDIAKRFGLTIDELMEINNLYGYVLRKNMILRLKKD